MTEKNNLDNLHPLEKKVIVAFNDNDQLETVALAEAAGIGESQARMAINWLVSKDVLKLVDESEYQEIALTDDGQDMIEKGTVEERVVNFINSNPNSPIPKIVEGLGLEMADVGKAIGKFKKLKAIVMGDGGSVKEVVKDIATPIIEEPKNVFKKFTIKMKLRHTDLTPDDLNIVKEFSHKRGNKGAFKVSDRKLTTYALTDEGKLLNKEIIESGGIKEVITQITQDMLIDGSWKDKDIRKFDISINPPRRDLGRKHPYREFLDNLKTKLTSMGFEEMHGSLVENEFWNMDALFMPQFHPARDIHDAYFVKNPTHSKSVDDKFMKSVSAAHQDGGDTNSKGWGYQFDSERTKRLVLRSQGTALSARQLAKGPKIPGRYYSIARCFRYDDIDATHAPDFYQVEGIIVGEGINFRTLLGILKLFAEEIAEAKEYRFDTGYFPYTEPSVELVAKHPKLGWLELGGAGIFRPEVTKPLGIDVPVIAWGIGIDRMAMVSLGVDYIRDLFSDDLDKVKSMKVRY